MELDCLERNVLKAIDMSCSVDIQNIIKVYKVCKSFDKTIRVIKVSTEHAIPLQTAIDWLGYN